jgi:hypothetical protein
MFGRMYEKRLKGTGQSDTSWNRRMPVPLECRDDDSARIQEFLSARGESREIGHRLNLVGGRDESWATVSLAQVLKL